MDFVFLQIRDNCVPDVKEMLSKAPNCIMFTSDIQRLLWEKYLGVCVAPEGTALWTGVVDGQCLGVPPPPPCPTNAVFNGHSRSDRIV